MKGMGLYKTLHNRAQYLGLSGLRIGGGVVTLYLTRFSKLRFKRSSIQESLECVDKWLICFAQLVVYSSTEKASLVIVDEDNDWWVCQTSMWHGVIFQRENCGLNYEVLNEIGGAGDVCAVVYLDERIGALSGNSVFDLRDKLGFKEIEKGE